MNPCYIGLGSNLDRPESRVRDAMARLETLPSLRVRAHSSLYRSEPWGVTDQPAFINAVTAAETALDADQTLAALLALEHELGRVRGARRWGARRIDLDLLIHGGARRDSPDLTLPHPRLHERAFVLVPLAELAPDLEIPGLGPVWELLAQVDAGGVEKL